MKVISILKYIFNRLLYRIWRHKIINGNKVINKDEFLDKYAPVYYSHAETYSFHGDSHFFVPLYFREKFDWMSAFQRAFHVPRPFFALVNNVELRGKRAIAFNSKGQILLESIGGSKGYLLKSGDAKYALFPWFYPIEEKLGLVLSLVSPLSRNYYHWVNDMLPLLEAITHLDATSSEKSKIIIDQNPPEFQRQYLILMGINDEDIIEWRFERIWASKVLIVSTRYLKIEQDHLWTKTNILSRASHDWVRSHFRAVANRDRKIYISRADVSTRRVIDEEALVAEVLSKYGFESIILSNQSVLDQIRTFQEASIIVTVHGAALTNLIFADDLRIIELFPEGRNTRHTSTFFQIAHFFNHEFWVVACREVNDNGDLYVDPVQIDNLLEKLLGKPEK